MELLTRFRTTAYGGRAKIPADVDLLVAGFSCVDFSNLNNRKKDLTDGGESGDTLRAILNYAERYCPRIIILENVTSAPWKLVCAAFEKIGYASESVIVDTKDYYIPHTRQRGYAICIYGGPSDKNNDRNIRAKDLESMKSTWKATIKDFKRPASCTVEAFLLDEDDPRIIRGREELSQIGRGDNRRLQEVDWARCHGRHQDYRAGLFLGRKRPLMRWDESGSCVPPDYMWQAWSKAQVDRIKDVLDIAWLRNLERGFDHQYKL